MIAASAPRGNDNPSASGNISHSPANFYRKLGDAYRASGRARPIFDTVGHNPYPATNAERPWMRHATSTTIGEGDYDRLMAVLQEAFGGTGQPLPGQGSVSIWYMEQGFQTTIDPAKTGLYRGTETDRQALPAWLGTRARRAPTGRRPTRRRSSPTRSTSPTASPASPRSSTSSSPTSRTSPAGSPACSGPT